MTDLAPPIEDPSLAAPAEAPDLAPPEVGDVPLELGAEEQAPADPAAELMGMLTPERSIPPGGMLPTQPTTQDLFAALGAEGEAVETPPVLAGRERFMATGQAVAPPPPPDPEVPVEEVEAPDLVEHAARLSGGRPDVADSRTLNVLTRMEQYQQESGGGDAAEDFEKFDLLLDRIEGDEAALFRRLKSGEGLSDEEFAQLSIGVSALSDATDGMRKDFRVGLIYEPSKVTFSDGGAYLSFTQGEPAGEGDPKLRKLTEQGIGPEFSVYASPDVLPLAALEQQTEKATTVVAGPEGSVSIVAPVDETSDVMQRNLFPALGGEDGNARWIPVQPHRVDDLRQVQMTADSDPTGRTESFSAHALLAVGGYPGLGDQDTIMFDVPSGDRKMTLPSSMASRMVGLGGASASQPVYETKRLTREDMIDEGTFLRAVDSNAWAVVPASAKAAASAAGFDPIDLDGAEPMVLVFGADPALAEEWASGGRHITNIGDSARQPGDDDDPDDYYVTSPDDETFTLKAFDGSQVEWDPGQHTEGDSLPFLPRKAGRVSRRALPVDPDQVHLAESMIQDLESRGAKNVVAHVRRPSMEGFVRAREHIYDDGVSLLVARTVDGAPTPNSVPVWVREQSLSAVAPNTTNSVDPEVPAEFVVESGDAMVTVREAVAAKLADPSSKVVVSTPFGKLTVL